MIDGTAGVHAQAQLKAREAEIAALTAETRRAMAGEEGTRTRGQML